VNDPTQRRPDITRARNILGWEPTVNLAEGLRLLIERSSRSELIGRTS